MRISDWSSDVCSSDLGAPQRRRLEHGTELEVGEVRRADGEGVALDVEVDLQQGAARRVRGQLEEARGGARRDRQPGEHGQAPVAAAGPALGVVAADRAGGRPRVGARQRSEEHTSELQSLMRVSYAVFCFK